MHNIFSFPFLKPVSLSELSYAESFGGREAEIRKIVSIISKRQHRSVLIWGEFGVGKSSLINQFIRTLTSKYAPEKFGEYSFLELDVAGLIAQSKENVSSFFYELNSMLRKNSKKVLIINNLENMVCSGYNFQAELMKLLAIPSICVLATVDTLEADLGYKNLYNMFFQINLIDPTASETAEMINQQVSDTAEFHFHKETKYFCCNVHILLKHFFYCNMDIYGLLRHLMLA